MPQLLLVAGLCVLPAAIAWNHAIVVAGSQEFAMTLGLRNHLMNQVSALDPQLRDRGTFSVTPAFVDGLQTEFSVSTGGMRSGSSAAMVVVAAADSSVLLESFVRDAPWVRCQVSLVGGTSGGRSCSTDALSAPPFGVASGIVGLLLAALCVRFWHRAGVRRGGWSLVIALTLFLIASGGGRQIVPTFDGGGPLLGDSVWHPSMLLKN